MNDTYLQGLKRRCQEIAKKVKGGELELFQSQGYKETPTSLEDGFSLTALGTYEMGIRTGRVIDLNQFEELVSDPKCSNKETAEMLLEELKKALT